MTDTNDTTVTVRRTFAAPRERVWEAFTDPAQVDQWWGPDGFDTTTDEMTVKPGGVWRFVMVGPDGEEYQNRVEYDAVEEPARLVYAHGSPDDPEQFRVTIALGDVENGGTELVMVMRFPTAVDLDEAIDHGADEGAKQTLGRLADHLAGSQPAGS